MSIDRKNKQVCFCRLKVFINNLSAVEMSAMSEWESKSEKESESVCVCE